MDVTLSTIMIYARNMKKTAEFYSTHFNFETTGEVVEGLIELFPKNGGSSILIHQAAKSIKLGQAAVKLTFNVENITEFIANASVSGVKFGAVHEANGYQFSNTKDPDGNSVSISSRAFRKL
ncbi:VOC family protein [Vibrio lentus]|uniref:Glyoxalase n=1 Tax=Vibrio lentus TaxID=136468 RepID=A0A2N7BYK2_9VIBR|nr:VOC family protein [Vibrio lentus]PME53334.1 glyoxalase [Vibrio lentus]PME66391.1 glyoxalase [Vibrio lentus]PME87349.1 glyoxalase [Vibrio lentus]PMG64914.1 glyoxalase [Vibrio lentus]PMH93284.1 glyoxalase [Vibrio lentus]